MKGGTSFHFVTDGIESALSQATDAAGDRDVRIGGGVATIRQYLQARLIDELTVAVQPVVLGEGELLWSGLDVRALGYEVAGHIQGERAVHVTLRKSA
jgi:dihydrofolate reductase